MFRNVPTRARRVHAVLCAAALALAGCGGEEPPGTEVRLDAAADGSLRFARSAIEAPRGRASIAMGNPSNLPHAIGVRGAGIEAVGATVGTDGVSKVTADLEPGAYELYCPVAGHDRAGMVAELTVR